MSEQPKPEKFPSMHRFAVNLREKVRDRVERITAARVKDPKELEASTPEERQEKFLAKSREVWRQFAAHGISITDKFTNKPKLLNRTDLDGAAALGILKMAGFDVSDVQYVKAGESVPGRIMVDTGYESGLVVEDNGTAFFDHHGKDSTKASISTAKLVYRILAETGFIERTSVLDALTKFITQVDNQTHPAYNTKEAWENSDKTMLGLYRFMDFEHLLQFFQDGHSETEILSDDELKKYSPTVQGQGKDASPEYKLLKGKTEQRRNIDQSKIKLQELEQDGFVVKTKYGRIVIDIGKRVQGGQLAIRAYGYDGYLIYNPEAGSFFLGINRGKLDFDPPQGVIVRDTMWIKPIDQEPLRAVLRDIVKVIGPTEDSRPSGKLQEFIEETERVFEVTPRPPKSGETNWTVGGLDKLGVLPHDFKPEPGKKYRTVIVKDTHPGERRGALLLRVLGLAIENPDRIVEVYTKPDSLKFDPEANRGQGGWKARVFRMPPSGYGRPYYIIGHFPPGTEIDTRKKFVRAEVFNEQGDICELRLINE
jgi:hypothetical protein